MLSAVAQSSLPRSKRLQSVLVLSARLLYFLETVPAEDADQRWLPPLQVQLFLPKELVEFAAILILLKPDFADSVAICLGSNLKLNDGLLSIADYVFPKIFSTFQ